MAKEMKINICDCTLRDGGYYTNWDFSPELVKMYFSAISKIDAITHVEIGYRSLPQNEYLGEYFYCPTDTLKMARDLCPNKKIAIMLNEKDTKVEDLDALLNPCLPFVDMVRMAVDPANINRALATAKEIKDRGFEVGFNIMYMSKWGVDEVFIAKLNSLEGCVSAIYLVDSFGSITPVESERIFANVAKVIQDIPIGFHGHNNMELALANSLVAINSGCAIIDSTFTGMGRGAGNLKTELLLTYLSSRDMVHFDYNVLNTVVDAFESLQKKYKWGTNLPYMISGAYALPQKEVMSWISKRRYTTEGIINALQNKKNKQVDNQKLPVLMSFTDKTEVVIVGGGENTEKHAHALIRYCVQNPQTVLVHAGVRYVDLFNKLSNKQYYCLLGSESNKLKSKVDKLNLDNITCVLKPSPRKMGTILPVNILKNSYELENINFTSDYPDTLLTIAFQLSVNLNAQKIYLFGLDGYDLKTDEQMFEVSEENQKLIDLFVSSGVELEAITATNYRNVSTKSIYSLI